MYIYIYFLIYIFFLIIHYKNVSSLVVRFISQLVINWIRLDHIKNYKKNYFNSVIQWIGSPEYTGCKILASDPFSNNINFKKKLK
jgi:hypothetical protein